MESICDAINGVTNAINSPMGWDEWTAIVVPILLSMLAIYISLLTVQKQSKIELFDKRYDVYCQIEQIINYKNSIKSLSVLPVKSLEGENFDFANIYLALWRSQDIEFDKKLNLNSTIHDPFEVVNKISTINMRKETEIKTLKKIELLYSLTKEENSAVNEFVEEYKKFIESMEMTFFKFGETDIKKSKEKFICACERVDGELLQKLKDVISVTKL